MISWRYEDRSDLQHLRPMPLAKSARIPKPSWPKLPAVLCATGRNRPFARRVGGLSITQSGTSNRTPRYDLHDQPFAAAFATSIVMRVNSLVQGYSFWTFSDIFEENSFRRFLFTVGLVCRTCMALRSRFIALSNCCIASAQSCSV